MAGAATIKARLVAFGFTLDHWRRAVRFYADRGFRLSYGGRGRFRGVFHVSRTSSTGVPGRARWQALRAYDPTEMLDAPTATIKQFAAV
jgi:hypothetical protein